MGGEQDDQDDQAGGQGGTADAAKKGLPPEDEGHTNAAREGEAAPREGDRGGPDWKVMVAIFVVLLTLSLWLWLGAFFGGTIISTSPHLKDRRRLVRPRTDARKYETAVLSNGLPVLAVQDERSRFAAFAVAVQSGSFDEPPELPGLAHFCEHMLFLGTEKYPEASEFDKFVQVNGGDQNAYTDSEVTVYYFSISQAVASEGLDRFADFFAHPLFNETFVEREVNAINSEHMKNIQSPGWRVEAVMDSLAAQESPVSHFGTGDLQTLMEEPRNRSVDVVKELRVYFRRHYCPTKLRVVSFGPSATSQQLEALASTFGGIEAGDPECTAEPRRSWATPEAWPPETKQKWVYIQGVTHDAALLVVFYLPDLQRLYKSKPLRYLMYVLRYKGEGSFFQLLRDSFDLIRGLAVDVDSSSAGWELTVTFELTALGRSHPNLLVEVLFAYIALLRVHGVDPLLHDSIVRRAQLDWDWDEPDSPVGAALDLAEKMTRLPNTDLLWGDSLVTVPNLTLATEMLGLLTPDNMNVAYVLPSTDSVEKVANATPLLLPHYGVKYVKGTVGDPAALQRWLTMPNAEALHTRLRSLLHDALGLEKDKVLVPRLPKAIEGIPRELDLKLAIAEEVKQGEDGNSITTDSKLFGPMPKAIPLGKAPNGSAVVGETEVWYRPGWASNKPTGSPRLSVSIAMQAMKPKDGPEDTPEEDIRMLLFNRLLAEEINPHLVDVEAAGGSVTFGASEDGISVDMGAFPPVLGPLVDRAMEQILKHETLVESTAARFKRIYDSVKENLLSNSGMPVSYAMHDLSRLLTRGTHSKEDLLQALERASLESASDALKEIVLRWPLQLTAFAMGNVNKEVAKKTVVDVMAKFMTPAKVQSAKDDYVVEYVSRVVNPVQPIEIRRINPREGDINDVVVVNLLAGIRTVRSRIILGILGDLLGQVAYEVLRTDMQLGYMVYGGTSGLSNVQMVGVQVQGDRMNADDMEAAVHKVLSKDMPARLRTLTDSEVESMKRSFRDSLEQQPLHTGAEIVHWWAPIADNSFCFSLREALLKEMDVAVNDKQPLIDEWERLFMKDPGGQAMRQILKVKYFAGQKGHPPPDPPALAKVKARWKEHNLPQKYMDMLEREHSNTKVLHKSDAQTRREVLEDSKKKRKGDGYFKTDLGCGPVAQHLARARRGVDGGKEAALLQNASTSRKAGSRATSLLQGNSSVQALEAETGARKAGDGTRGRGSHLWGFFRSKKRMARIDGMLAAGSQVEHRRALQGASEWSARSDERTSGVA